MPIGGKLLLKGGEPLGVQKKKKKKKPVVVDEAVLEEAVQGEDAEGAVGAKPVAVGRTVPGAPPLPATAVSVQSGKAYEQEFDLEIARMHEGKTRNTPWGSTYRAPPQILHGYSKKVKGDTAEERLDLRCAMKADKFCK